jgi:peptide-methionine (R)-S-oxide reductase
MEKVYRSETEWRKRLTPEQYYVLRDHGTEPAFGNRYWHEKRKGTYVCAGCGLPLFRSERKYDSGTGWPSFWEPVDPEAIETRQETLGMRRVEVRCARCGGHLGHVFDDGPAPTGKRYCLNSAALKLKGDEEEGQ